MRKTQAIIIMAGTTREPRTGNASSRGNPNASP